MIDYDNPTVFIIDDDPEVLQALKWLFESVQINVACFKDAATFLEQYDTDWCGCILTDIRMPQMSGLQLLDELEARKNHLPVIVITGHGDIPMAVKAMKSGAVDFISKPFNDQYLLEQIQKAISKSIELAQTMPKIGPTEDVKLTKREKEVMALIADGKLNKQIAHELNISLSTVEFHRARLMRKMGARNVAQLIKHYLYLENETYSNHHIETD